MTDGSGTHTFTYKASGALDLDSCTSGILSGINVDPYLNGYGQRSGLTATVSGTTIGSTVYYGWDSGARPYTIGAANFSSSGALAYFSYLSKSDLPSATTFYNTYPLTLMTTSRTFDGFNRLQSVSNKIGYSSTVINSHTYAYNTAGRRSTATVETGDVWNWIYNDRGEVTDAKKAWSGGGYLRGRTFTYGYDNIGNRTTHSSGGTTAGGTTRTTGYTINPDGTNEIQSIANPSAFDVTGLASGTVTVGDNPLDTALMQGGFFHSERNETAEAGKVQPGLRHVVVTAGGNALHGDVYVPEATETTTCDGSGNLTSDSRWTYTWTEDNRLREIATRSTSGIANASASCVRVAFDYDYFGRRVQKRTYINYNWNTPGSGTLSKTVKYVWDGWNCIAELNGVDSKFFIWGPDLSGGDGAGGVGGLLFVQDLSGTYALETNHCVAYDGNGNVTAIVDGMYGSGAVEAAYEYDPFGNAIRQSGPYALTNPFRFSTKFIDDESGFVYYGYRYYDPVRGRWPSRDPIGEDGGVNLYGMVENDPLNWVDSLGLEVKGPLKIAMLGANPDADNPHNVDGAPQWKAGGVTGGKGLFTAREDRAAIDYIIKYFDSTLDGKLNSADCPPFKIRLVGYSWGGWSSLKIAHKLSRDSRIVKKGDIELAIGTVDPVNTLRDKSTGIPLFTGGFSTTKPKGINIVASENYYQKNGIENGLPNKLFNGESVTWFSKNMDVSRDLSPLGRVGVKRVVKAAVKGRPKDRPPVPSQPEISITEIGHIGMITKYGPIVVNSILNKP